MGLACTAAGQAFWLRVQVLPGKLRVHVCDADPGFRRLRVQESVGSVSNAATQEHPLGAAAGT